MRILTILALCFLHGCSNSVEENQGALPNIHITGTVLNGNVRYAKLKLVGIDQYGQPQRDSDGVLLGDTYYTDESGRYSAYIQGAYVGPLLAVAQYDSYSVTLTSDADEQASTIEQRSTQIRCALTNGCRNEAGDSVDFGEWYDAPEDFELWSIVNDGHLASEINISPFTHLSARLAFSEFQWDGTGSCDASSCDGSITINSLITPQKIHEANTRLQGIFGFDSNIANYISPFSPFATTEQNLDAQDTFKHGLLTLAWQYRVRESSSDLMSVLNHWLTDSFLNNQGQLYEDGSSSAPTQWDLKTAYEDAIALHAELNLDDATSQTAIAAMQSRLSSFGDAITNVQGGTYDETLEEKITSAKQTVAKIQSWFIDYETKNFVNFFDAGTATQIHSLEQDWEEYQGVLGPQLQSVFSPMVQIVDYALQCLATQTSNTQCDTSSTYVFEDTTASVEFNAVNNQFTYSSITQPNTNITGQISTDDTAGLIKTFTFTQDINVESDAGLGIVQSRSDNRASITVHLEEAISIGQVPEMNRIELNWPKLTLKAKDTINGGYFAFDYIADDVSVVLQGVKDPWREAEPYHFNIESVNVSGVLSDDQNSVIVDVILNGDNVDLHYPSNRFPNLDVVWSASDFKRFMRFEEGAMDAAQLAGFVALPSDVILGETLPSAVEYLEIDRYSSLDSALQAELNLSGLFRFEFGALEYPGGHTGLAVYKTTSSSRPLVKQCEESNGVWSCSDSGLLENLGCSSLFVNDTGYSDDASVADAFLFLKNDTDSSGVGCIPQVKIVGRGVYDIEYGAITEFSAGDLFDVTLDEPTLLGLSSFSLRLISNDNGVGSSPIYFNVTGAINDPENVNVLVSLTHGYYGIGNTGILGLEAIIPFGERTIWFLLGKDESEFSDALVYLFLDGQVEITMTAFDYAAGSVDHSEPLGYIRYDEQLVGTLSQENGLYVVRYVDGSWQLL